MWRLLIFCSNCCIGLSVPSQKYASVLSRLCGGTFRPKIASFRLKIITNSPKLAQYDLDQFGPKNRPPLKLNFKWDQIRGTLSEIWRFRCFSKVVQLFVLLRDPHFCWQAAVQPKCWCKNSCLLAQLPKNARMNPKS